MIFYCTIQWISHTEITGLSSVRLVSGLSQAATLGCSCYWWCLQIWQISETCKSGTAVEQSETQKPRDGATQKFVAFSPREAAIAKPRSGPLTSESSKVRRSEIATQVTFYMIPALLLASKNCEHLSAGRCGVPSSIHVQQGDLLGLCPSRHHQKVDFDILKDTSDGHGKGHPHILRFGLGLPSVHKE
jgi:hypothetical protein